MCRAILMLPQTAQAFVRDTVSAFRQIFLHRSQWTGTVVEWQGAFYVDMFLAFGLGPACGVYGLFGDALADIARAEGISPNGHWVDDNTFLRFPFKDLKWVNEQRRLARATLLPDAVHDYGRTYWVDQDGFRHGEDYSQPARILPGAEDGFNCGLADIDRLSAELGWPWAPEKDAPWASNFTYGGIDFHIATRELSLLTKKRTKYTAAIDEWQGKADGSHTLNEAQSLHGKLEHATVVYKHGKWRLKGLLDFIRSASKTPKTAHSLRHQDPRIKSDLAWWKQELERDRYRSTFWTSVASATDPPDSEPDSASMGKRGAFPFVPLTQESPRSWWSKPWPSNLPLSLSWLWAFTTLVWSLGPTTQPCLEPSRKAGWRPASPTRSSLAWRPSSNNMAFVSTCSGSRPRTTQRTDRPGGSHPSGSSACPSQPSATTQPTGSRQAGDIPDGNEDEDSTPPNHPSQTPEKTHKAPAKRKTFAEIVSAWSRRSKINRTAPPSTHTPILAAASTSEPVDNEVSASASPQTATPPSTTPADHHKKKIQTRRFQPNTIVVKPHPNRPDVDGPKRFSSWVPERQDGQDPQPASVRKVLLAAFAKGTHKGYSTGLAQWHHFCDLNNVPERDRGPAPPHLVELWVSQQAGTKSGGYLKDWISALKAWHHINKLPWTIDDNRIQLIRRGATEIQPPPRPQSAPMTVEWLNAVIRVAKLNNPTELVTVTVATCGLWGLFRLGELLLEKVSDFDPLLHVKRTNVSSQAASVNGRPTVIVTVKLPRTKTSTTGDTVVLAPQESPSDPVGLLQLHLQRNQVPEPDRSPLFSYWEDGSFRVLNKRAFERTLQSLADRAKLPGVHGHSMRIGGCTTLLIRNIPTDKVMLHGRWDSIAFKRYIRNHAEILAPFLASNVAVRQQLVAADPELAEALPGEGNEVPQGEEDNDRPQEERANVAPPDRSSAARAPAANANRAIPATGSARTSASRVGF